MDLFSENPKDACSLYVALRNDPCWEGERQFCNDLWKEYQEFADKDFLAQFPLQTHQRWFEMYLTVVLMRAGLAVQKRPPVSKKGKSGPDILIKNGGKNIWIEAVCAGPGAKGHKDSLPGIEPDGKVHIIDLRQIIFRHTHALDEKQKQFRQWIEDGTVSKKDIMIVAINTYGIMGLSGDDGNFRRGAFYGEGDIAITIDQESGKYLGVSRPFQESRLKANASKVPTAPFINGTMPHISAAITSGDYIEKCALTPPEKPGHYFYLSHNMDCDNKLPMNTIKLGVEEAAHEEGSKIIIKQTSHRKEV